MAFDFTGFASIPGIDAIQENLETVITWGPWDYNKAFIVPCLLDGAIRDLGASPTTLLRAGLLLGQKRSDQKCLAWNDANTDGTEEIFGVLLWDAVSQQLGVDKDRWFGFALVGGNIKAGSLIIDAALSTGGIDGKAEEYLVRGTMGGRFMFDDNYHQHNGAPLMGGWKAIRHKTADYTVLEADNGSLFTNKGDVDAIEFTLPAITNSMGQRYMFYAVADFDLKVSSAAAGDLICLHNAAASSVTLSTASHIIGSAFEVIGLDNGSWIVIPHLADDGVIVTVA